MPVYQVQHIPRMTGQAPFLPSIPNWLIPIDGAGRPRPRGTLRGGPPGPWRRDAGHLVESRHLTVRADVAELADARDLKSWGPRPCGFESHRRHQIAGTGDWHRSIRGELRKLRLSGA